MLPVAGIIAGFILGTMASDWWFGWSSFSLVARAQLPVSIAITVLAGVAITYYFYSRNKAIYLERKMSEARGHASEARLLDVTDTGVGFDVSAPPGGGFGMAQVRERLAAAYGDKGQVAQRVRPGGGSVTDLQIPLAPAMA